MVLPIVERELRVAARRKATHWARFVGAVLAMGIIFFLLFGDTFGRRPQAAGHVMFCVLSGTALAFCTLAGVFLSAGCLCAEKRDGTLGLLFLTDLKGWDIVLGKLTASSVVSVYAVLAVIPMLGLPILLGGVTAGEFGRMTLVLLVTLMLSLATGMLASALCWETRTAMLLTLGVQVALSGGLFVVMWLVWALTRTRVVEIMLPSPVLGFAMALDATYASSTGAAHFWTCLALMAGLAVAGLIVASWVVPRRGEDGWNEPSRRRRAGDRTRGADPELLADNPFAWLAGRDRFPGWPTRLSLGLLLLLWIGFLAAAYFARSGLREPMLVTAFFMAHGLHLLAKVLMAVQATRQLGEDRRVGALELIVVTPLATESVVAGCRRVFHRQFRWINLALHGVNLTLFLLVLVGRPFGMPEDVAFLFCLIVGGGAVLLATDTHALGWVGVWAALQGQQPYRAVLRTLGRVLAFPWLCLFLFILTISGSGLSEETAMVSAVLWVVLGVTTGIVAVERPRRELKHHFRALAAGDESALAAVRAARFPAGS